MIVTFAAALLSMQSGAAPLATGSCAAERTAASDRQSMASALRQGTAPAPAVTNRIRDHLADCTPAGTEATNDALLAAVSYIGRDEIGRDLSSSGVDPQIIDRWFERQSDAIKINWKVTEAQGDEFGRQWIAAGAPAAAVEANAEKIGGYFATLVILERLRRGLPTPE